VTDRPSDVLLAWAAVGSRASGFNHDCASKLQSLMMALDEATEFIHDPSEVQRSVETASAAVKELLALLTENRALTKPPAAKTVELASVLQRAANRHGIKLRGEIGTATIKIAPPSFVHAIALLLDMLAGPASSTRAVEIDVRSADGQVVLGITGQPPAASASDAIDIATWMIEREGGKVLSAPGGFHVHLPAA
jgi:hypothetical protein